METQAAIISQYRAALSMLRAAIERCPGEHWCNPAYTNRFWNVAYHALFFTDLYLCESDAAFKPWEKHRVDYQYLGPLWWDGNRVPAIGEPYTKEEVIEYLDFCERAVQERMARTELSAPSGFHWLPFGKLELQFYNIRHIQHHAAQLIERLREDAGIAIEWVRGVPA
ncbi:MAG: DinB family protein [Candidatus Hydrogenedentes bacterium]|nr:DinB family protein [Candidatus Hydrogenedentota bacterium]